MVGGTPRVAIECDSIDVQHGPMMQPSAAVLLTQLNTVGNLWRPSLGLMASGSPLES
jgi:hypothetical protein